MSVVDSAFSAAQHSFNTTHWSIVLSARENDSMAATDALEKLCRIYWVPVYFYIRRKISSVHDAEDLTQQFFFRLLSKNFLSQVDPSKGRFRSFLLVAVNHFLSNEWDRSRALKRGGGVSFISLDSNPAAHEFIGDSNLPPDVLYERQWVFALLREVLGRLREEYAANGKEQLFDQLKSFLAGDKGSTTYSSLALTLNTTEGALKMAVQRLRQRYAEFVRAEISNTVSSPDDLEVELRHFLSVLNT